VSRSFFAGSDTSWPIAILDNVFGSLLWLKTPMKAPELPKKKIIADALAGSRPSRRIWDRFLKEIDNLQSTDRISEEELLILREGPDVERLLMQLTAGNVENVNSQLLNELKSKVKEEISKPLLDEIVLSREEASIAKDALDKFLGGYCAQYLQL
jgi:hypothetical protein